jgi:hypothetical protein
MVTNTMVTFEMPFCGDFSAISFAFLALDREKSLSLVVEVLPGMFCTLLQVYLICRKFQNLRYIQMGC